MAYVNVEAFVNDEHPKTKAALKRAMTEAPGTVRFDCTSPMGLQFPDGIAGDAVPEGITLSIAGPDPYRARNWFANVKLNAKGKAVVS